MRGVVWCGVLWRGVVWFGVLWCGVAWCGCEVCDVVWCGVAWHGVAWCGCQSVCQLIHVTAKNTDVYKCAGIYLRADDNPKVSVPRCSTQSLAPAEVLTITHVEKKKHCAVYLVGLFYAHVWTQRFFMCTCELNAFWNLCACAPKITLQYFLHTVPKPRRQLS